MKLQLEALRRSLRLVGAAAFVTYKEWSEYRSHMVVSLLVGPLYFLVQMYIWSAVLSAGGSINGMSLPQLLTYYGIAALIGYLIFDFSDWNLQMLISTGKFMTFIQRPMPHRLFSFSQKIGHRALGFGLEFIPVYALFYFVFKVRLIPERPLWFLLSIALSFVLLFFINYTIGISAFWLTRTVGLRRAYAVIRDICAGVFIPLTFFPHAIQKLLFFLPFQYVTYVPIRVFIGSYELAGIHMSMPQIVGCQALAVIAMAVVCEVLWRLGIRKFTGEGA
jgi:ABC-2 type transport system permease protein